MLFWLFPVSREKTMRLLNTVEAANRLTAAGFKHTAHRVAWLARKRKFPNARREEGSWYIPESDLEDYLDQCQARRRGRPRRWPIALLIACLTGTLPVLANLSSVVSAVVDIYQTWQSPETTALRPPPPSKQEKKPSGPIELPPPEPPADCRPVSECCRICDRGKACGKSCINRGLTCHKEEGCACNQSDLCA